MPGSLRIASYEPPEKWRSAQNAPGPQLWVWAATNAALIEAWVPPVGVKQVLIAGDNDAGSSWAGQAADLAKRLVRDGYAVDVEIPGLAGKDWADAIPPFIPLTTKQRTQE